MKKHKDLLRQPKRKILALTVVASLSASPLLSYAIESGDRFRVNTYVRAAQSNAKVAMDADGDFVIVWESSIQDSNGLGVFGQRYDKNGVPQGGEFQVNTFTIGNQYRPSVAMDADGDFVVSWTSNSSDCSTSRINMRLYDKNGNPISNEMLVDNQDALKCSILQSSITMQPNGNIAVAWNRQNHNSVEKEIAVQQYNALGVLQGPRIRVSSYTSTGPQDVRYSAPDIAMDADGDFVVVWDISSNSYGRRYNSSGVDKGEEFEISPDVDPNLPRESTHVAMDADGDFVVTWGDFIYYGIYARRFDSTGSPNGQTFQVNTCNETKDIGSGSDVAMNNDSFIVSWDNINCSGLDGQFAQIYSSSGQTIGDVINVETSLFSGIDSSIALDADGDFVVAYDARSSNQFSDIYARRFGNNLTPSIQNYLKNNIVYMGRTGIDDTTEEIFSIESQTDKKTRLTDNNVADGTPSLSPDGRTIVFSSKLDGEWDLYKMDLDSRQMLNLTNTDSSKDEGWPSISPVGNQVLYKLTENGSSKLAIMDIDGSNNSVELDQTYGHAAWSPNGRDIIMSGVGGVGGLYLYDLQLPGSAIQQTSGNYDDYPIFTNDAQYVLFGSDRCGNGQDKLGVFLLDLYDKKVSEIVCDPNVDYRYFSMMEDGRLIFTSGDNNKAENRSVYVTAGTLDFLNIATLKNAILSAQTVTDIGYNNHPVSTQNYSIVASQPNQPALSEIPNTQSTNAVVITHGWNSSVDVFDEDGDESGWIVDTQNYEIGMADRICTELDLTPIPANGDLVEYYGDKLRLHCSGQDWDVFVKDWRSLADVPIYTGRDGDLGVSGANIAHSNAATQGFLLGRKLSASDYSHIHFLAHSAGSNLIDHAKNEIQNQLGSAAPSIHMTFLDAYDPAGTLQCSEQHSEYGMNADWVDNYFDTRNISTNATDWTRLHMDAAFNVDVTTWDPTPNISFSKKHKWPYEFYRNFSFEDSDSNLPIGFGLSKIQQGFFPPTSRMLGSLCTLGEHPQNQSYPECLTLTGLCGNQVVEETSITLGSSLAVRESKSQTGVIEDVISGEVDTIFANLSTGSPAWVQYRLDEQIDFNSINISFEFLGQAEGLLTIYFNGNVIGYFDQRIVGTGKAISPQLFVGDTEGERILSFRLDEFGGSQAKVGIIDVNLLSREVLSRTDIDNDGIINDEDLDDDNDGIQDGDDIFPLDSGEWLDSDLDGIGNNTDNNDDNDGFSDGIDNCLFVANSDQLDTNNDGVGDACDRDGDGVIDSEDLFPDDPNESIDTDGDGVGNNADTDDDNDGVLDSDDAFPLDNNESVDTDGDGVGNNADTDDDNDGIFDVDDNCSLISSPDQTDTDADGFGNLCDLDDDDDGILDEDDNCPLKANPNQIDVNSNGVGDACELSLSSEIELVSISTTNSIRSKGSSAGAAINKDGRFVVFSNDGTNFDLPYTGEEGNVYLRDRLLGTTEKISQFSDAQLAERLFDDINYYYYSSNNSISDDGRFVTFGQFGYSGGSVQLKAQVYLRDRELGVTTLISTSPSGDLGNNHSIRPSISSDGHYIAYSSSAENLTTDGSNGYFDIFIYDTQNVTTERVTQPSNGNSYRPSISANGNFIAFISEASNLVSGDSNQVTDVFIYDRTIKQIDRVNVSTASEQANGSTTRRPLSLSEDGRFVAFHSNASNLVSTDTNNVSDIFVRDRLKNKTIRVSESSDGQQSNDFSHDPSLDASGRFVVFHSGASNLVNNDTNNANDVFIHDLNSSITKRISLSKTDQQGNSWSANAEISDDGKFITFTSEASNLVDDALNFGDREVFVTTNTLANSDINVDGAPSIDKFSDSGWFIWRENGNWVNHFLSGTSKKRFIGKINSEISIHSLLPISIEANDILELSTQNAIDFKLNIGTGPYRDGFTMSFDETVSTCVSLIAPLNESIYLGPDKISMPSNFDLVTLEDCLPPKIQTIGRPTINRSTDRGVFLWENSTNNWQFEFVPGVNYLSRANILIDSSEIIDGIKTFSLERNDSIVQIPTRIDLKLKARAPWYDGLKFSIKPDSISCLSASEISVPFYIGPHRIEVGNEFNLTDQGNCELSLRADVNNDGKITSADATLIQRFGLDLDMTGTGWVSSPATGDSNCDGKTNIIDASLVGRFSAGLDMSQTTWCIR